MSVSVQLYLNRQENVWKAAPVKASYENMSQKSGFPIDYIDIHKSNKSNTVEDRMFHT